MVVTPFNVKLDLNGTRLLLVSLELALPFSNALLYGLLMENNFFIVAVTHIIGTKVVMIKKQFHSFVSYLTPCTHLL